MLALGGGSKPKSNESLNDVDGSEKKVENPVSLSKKDIEPPVGNTNEIKKSNEISIGNSNESLASSMDMKLGKVTTDLPVGAPIISKPKPDVPEVQLISKWMEEMLETLFNATINPNHPSKNLVYLASLHEDIQSSNGLLNEEYLESIFMEILTDRGIPSKFKTPIEYLYHVYQASYNEKRKLEPKFKQPIIKQIIKLSTSYGFICFQVPDMFINSSIKDSIDVFIRKFSTLSQFLVDIVESSIEQDGLLELLNLFLPTLASGLRRMNINNRDYVNYLSLFQTFVNIKPVAAVFSQVDGFQPPSRTTALDFENKTLLGPLLKLSPLSATAAPYYFTENASELSQSQVSNTYDSVNGEYKVLIDRLFFIVDKLIRGSTQTRLDLLTWFAELINHSHLRRGSHADLKTLASDGFTYNITMILIKLSLPFLDYPVFLKTKKIDRDYWGKSKMIDILDESRVNSTIKEADAFYDENSFDDNSTNFISDCFFLTLTYLHYGLGGVIIHFDRIKQLIKQYSERIQMIEQNRVPPGSNPAMLAIMKSQIAPYKKQLNVLVAQKHAILALFESRQLQDETFDFIIGACTFFIRVFNPNPEEKIKIPIYKIQKVSELEDHEFLKTKTPVPWKFYPEYMIEGIINYCKFSGNFRGCPLINNSGKVPIFVEFSIILLRSPELLGNPHMKANIVEVLFYGSMPMGTLPGFFVDIINGNQLVRENILYSLLDFYVMVEKTGASSQFYDKFNTRFYISNILEELWKNLEYRKQLENYSRHNVEFFIRFVARMLNDTTYLLDETFTELNKIHNYQKEKRARALGQQPNEEFGTDEELAGKLESSERTTKSYMQLSNKTMQLFNLFTKEVPQAFTLPEIVDRLASMLDYNLSVMVGPKASNLKVENPETYGFNPRETLKSLCNIYINLSGESKFTIAVSRDGRSFSLSYFQKAKEILTRNYVDARSIDKFIKFAEEADKQRQLDEDEELELGEIPDEFLDPLMYTLMEDPVILPGSKITIDRSTIRAHLLSDATDPFNRMPLKIEDVTPDVEMLEKIKNFKLAKRAEVLAQSQAEEVTDMDVDKDEDEKMEGV